MTTLVLENRVLTIKDDFESIREHLIDRPGGFFFVTEITTYYPPEYGFSGKPKEVIEMKVLINSRYVIEVKND